ncbi:MAG: KH domain-containing protein [Candidatus Hodarchaeota archaeon]
MTSFEEERDVHDALEDDESDEEYDDSFEIEEPEEDDDPENLDDPEIPEDQEGIEMDDDEDEDDDEGGTERPQREIVVPGQIVGKKDPDTLSGYGTITDKEGRIVSLYIGFMQKRGKYINVVPFKGRYIPHVGDKVIGKVVDKNVVLWKLDINSPYVAILRPSDDSSDRGRGRDRGDRGGRGGHDQRRSRRPQGKGDTSTYNVGDLLIAKVIKFSRTTEPSLTTVGPDLGKIKGGFITNIAVPKIPRLIGKSGSMIKLLNSLTSCKIFVAQNGIVWIRGKNPSDERLLVKAIRKIEREAHTRGLTDRVKEFIQSQLSR